MTFILKLPLFRSPVRQYTANVNNNLIKVLKTMPKDPQHIADIQKQRNLIKLKSSKFVPGRVTLQVLGTGAKGAPRSVYLFSDQSRYLFNCGEGTQRLAHEHKTKLSKLEHIFVTQPTWKNMGGLPGTALTIQDVGVPQITLHGPEELNQIFPATRRFVVLRDLKISVAECEENDVFEDNVLKVKYVHLLKKYNDEGEDGKGIQAAAEHSEAATSTRDEKKRSRRRSKSRSRNGTNVEEDNIDYYAHERKKHRRRSRSRSRNPETGKRVFTDSSIYSLTQTLLLQDTKHNKKLVICYICQLQPRPGSLNLDECVKRGVKPGPMLGMLKSGEDVTLDNGQVVKSKDVCDPDDPGPVFIVVDCPSREYLESLTTNAEIRKHQRFAECDEDVATLVVHFTPPEVMDLPEYKEWMDKFTFSTQHLDVNERNLCMGSTAVHRIQYKLNLLDEHIFPVLADIGTPVLGQDNPSRHVGSLTSFHLRPKKGFYQQSHVNLNIDEYVGETMALEQFPEALKELKEKIDVKRASLDVKEYPKVLFLGTGSCIPNKTRNTSGILIQSSEKQNIVFDCGEGTCGQLLRFFGSEEGDKVLSDIESVYISHLHADHHIGLIGLLQGRRRALDRLNIDKPPLYLFAPKQILSWLTFYDKFFESIEDEFVLVPNSDLIFTEPLLSQDRRSQILTDLNLKDISTCLVKHCPNAFGVSITDKNGIKITYSGDTMPCSELVELGKNSNILIHEATMEDELEKEAVVKMHSTTSQAIEVGRQMQAKHTILTHFSQRYAKLPRFNDNFAENVSIAFDNMLIKLDELPLIPLFYPALKIMFAEHYEEMKQKAVKRQLKSERQASLDRNPKLKKS